MRQLTRRGIFAGALLGAVLAGAAPALALSLDEARAQGLVGERTDGYVGIVTNGPGVQALVDSVNARRREVYQQTAQSSGQPLAVVQQLAADRIISSQLSPGMYYMNAGGQWVRK